MLFGPHTLYILVAYGLGACLLLGTSAWGIWRHRRYLKARIRLEVEIAYLREQITQNNTPLAHREAS